MRLPRDSRLASRAGWLLPHWMQSPLVLAAVAFALVLLGGTLGYIVVEGWSPWDAFYMTVITVTTVGYGEVHPLSWTGEAFTSVLLIVGVATALYVFSLFGARIVESGLQRKWEERKRERMLDDLTNHFIICGYGRIGGTIAEEFVRQRVPFVIVERDPELIQSVLERGVLAVLGDASSEYVLKRVGVERARGLLAAVSTDAENVYTILSARLMNPKLYIIGRAETEESARKLKRAGADRVIAPYQIGALHMAQLALRPAVMEFVQLVTSSEFMDLSMEQVTVGPTSTLAGQTLAGSNLRQRFGIIVIGIRRASGHMDFNPPPEALMQVGDHLVVLGKPDSLVELGRHAA